jgi:glycosyltransferase involved in cell wall biosynthesis
MRRLLGGGSAGVEILTRSHVYLLQAIERLLERDPSLAGSIELQLAGVLSQTDRELAAGHDAVKLLGYLPHAESVALIRSADLLFLPMQKLSDGKRSTTVPGKTYEYLAAGRPILAAVPPGDARDILLEAGNAYICEPDDVEAMTEALTTAVRRWRAGEAVPAPAPEVVQRYERRALAARLASVLTSVGTIWMNVEQGAASITLPI